ncbi:hypothetical protein P171DRAFT_505230 [Karstenula rhodostoma CBS 690.94]|uniref:Uncharacterized protein n=1 Tax=Karstenula rhodostoma CBS 690.94 TaxID=1392251 RepID=A0A9P4P7F4_9PLEO|nr:hypothetical protein P171DRAFT_505230 [Karstenula rhodostoma CBS 690.94]
MSRSCNRMSLPPSEVPRPERSRGQRRIRQARGGTCTDRPTATRIASVDFVGQRPRRLSGVTITNSLFPASVDKNTMFDIFEPDTRDATVSNETISTVCGFVAVEAPSSSAMSAQALSTTSTSAQTEEAVTTASTAVQTPGELYAEDIYISSLADFATDDCANAAEDENTAASQEPTIISQEPTNASQELTAPAPDSATASQGLVDQQTPKYPQASQPSTSTSLTTSSSSPNALSGSAVKQILESIPFRDYYPDRDLFQLLDSIKYYDDCIDMAEKASDGLFASVTELDWRIRKKRTFISLVMREQENKNSEKKNRLKSAFPAAVVHAKNATDPCICNDLQPSPAVLDPKAELQDAVEAWRDTVDGQAEDYRDATYGEHWWRYMEYEDFDGIDNNEYHDYFPNVPPKVVYHSTAVQTKLITSPLVYEKVYGREPTKVESREILRTIGSRDYVDRSEVWYGKPFLDPNGPYLDTQTNTQDSGFQTMDFEVKEANILKAKAKAGITASKLNKLSMERDNGIRVFAQPLKDRVVHSQQFNALRPIISKAGTVESYGGFTPMIHNVVYEDIQNKSVTTVTRANATPLACSPSKNSLQPKTPKMKAMEPKKIPSYCRSPSPGLYEDSQSSPPELFENGWPMNQFPLKEVDGTFSQDISKDFGLPDPDRRHKAIREVAYASVYPGKTAHRNSTSTSTQQKPGDRVASEAPRPFTTMKSPHTLTQQKYKGGARKRSMGQMSDEGYKSHSPPSSSSSKRQKIEERTTASSSHFSTPYDTYLSPDAVKISTPTSIRPETSAPRVDDRSSPVAQTSGKRKRDASPVREPSGKIEQSNSKRPRLQPTPTPIRRLPPTESTLKVITPKSNLKAKAVVNQKKVRPTATQATHAAPTVDANASLPRTQQLPRTQKHESARQQVQLPIPATPAPKHSPATAPSRPAWADRKPTANQDSKKEKPNRWRINLGAAGLGRRHDPYNANVRPGRRN